MSATPRPWWFIGGGHDGACQISHGKDLGVEDGIVAGVRKWDDAEVITRAVNAFDALLAVALAAEVGSADAYCPICSVFPSVGGRVDHVPSCPYALLDAAHPDWREWVHEGTPRA